jgi:cytochrome c5
MKLRFLMLAALFACSDSAVPKVPDHAPLALQEQVVAVDQDIHFTGTSDRTLVLGVGNTLSAVTGGRPSELARVEAPFGTRWVDATAIPAPDGRGRWIVAVTEMGNVRRVDNATAVDIAPIFGIKDTVRWVREVPVSFGVPMTTFGMDGRLMLADGTKTLTLETTMAAPAVAPDRLAGIAQASRVFEIHLTRVNQKTEAQSRSRELAGVSWVGYAHNVLYALADGTLWRAEGDKDFKRVEGLARIIAASAAEDTLWYLDDTDAVCILATPNRCAKRTHTKTTKLVAVGAAYVALVEPKELILLREDPRIKDWSTDIAPIFSTACSACHGAGQAIDLSRADAWISRAEAINNRVLVKKDMPPSGNVTDAQREAVRAWLLCNTDVGKCRP